MARCFMMWDEHRSSCTVPLRGLRCACECRGLYVNGLGVRGEDIWLGHGAIWNQRGQNTLRVSHVNNTRDVGSQGFGGGRRVVKRDRSYRECQRCDGAPRTRDIGAQEQGLWIHCVVASGARPGFLLFVEDETIRAKTSDDMR
jgi:hypothetical protein